MKHYKPLELLQNFRFQAFLHKFKTPLLKREKVLG